MVKTQNTPRPPEEPLLTGRKGTLARATHSPVAIRLGKTDTVTKADNENTNWLSRSFSYLWFVTKVECFTAENIHNHLSQWKSVTSDRFIIDIVKTGLKLRFAEEPAQNICHNIPVTKAEKQIISIEIQKLLQKEVIHPWMREKGDFVICIYPREMGWLSQNDF